MTIFGWGKFNRRSGEFSTGVDRRQPIVVDTAGVTVVGHVRLRAAESMALAEVPVHVASDLTPVQVRAYRLMDNRSHDEATWDLDLIGLELQGI
jgi:ParB-like chromosome segregation protein Spo0J